MKSSYWLLLGAFCLAMPLSAAKPEAKAPAKETQKVFKPVLEDNCIKFGSKALKLHVNGELEYISGKDRLLSIGMPFYHVEKGQHSDWNVACLDKTKSKIIRDGNKYTWELWYKKGNIKPFRGIAQTLEVLPDGRLFLTTSWQYPTDLKEYKLKSWHFGFTLKSSLWEKETINMDGKLIKFAEISKQHRTAWNQKKLNWVFAEKNPAKKFAMQAELGKKDAGIGIGFVYRQSWGKKDYQVRCSQPGSKVYKVYLDFRP